MNEDKPSFATLGHFTIDAERFNNEPRLDDLPIIATRDFVLFPDVTFPITMGRKLTLDTAQMAGERCVPVGIVCQLDPGVENPAVPGDVCAYGVFADILQVIDMPDGNKTAIVRARGKFKVDGPGKGEMMPGSPMSATVTPVRETRPRSTDKEFFMLLEAIKESMLNILKKSGNAPDDIKFNIEHTDRPDVLINLVATYAPFGAEFKQRLLAQGRLKERAFMLLTELSRNEQLLEINRDIQKRTRQRIDEAQRTAFLQQQMEAIREELYGDEEDAAMFREKAEGVKFPEPVAKTFAKEVDKLERLSPQSPDYSVQYTYLQTLLDLPWGVYDTPNTDFNAAEAILDSEHYGLEKVKERILEQIAVILNNPEGKAPILCLVGAPGVGKTSLGQSIARAMGRKYQRVSLGGLHDEAEIRGHRRTYIGAMPGRIIDAMRRVGSSNPVVLLDEVDKIGQDFKGDPSAALLEVLDPEQNWRFHDNYVDVDFDLSKVLFIATANTLSTLSQPLLDRMEIIDIAGYLAEEKIEIARRHLLPRLLKENNIGADEIAIPDDTIAAVIANYTSESGVRQLEKNLAKIVRRTLLNWQRGERKPVTVEAASLKEHLGVQRYSSDRYEGNDYAGVVTGLAWTSVGGEILYIESSLSPSKAFGVELTGNLGTVMKESAAVAVQYVKAHAAQLGIPAHLFSCATLNIHAPEGAVPKDGPSAGITIVTSIVSAMRQVKVRERVAMTGEITLRGKVLPVGGIKEKILAAKRSGITDIILSSENRRDIEDINARYLEGLTFHYVGTIAEVLAIAITDEPVDNPLTIPEPAAK